MIVTRSPLRIPLGGGGTDLPSYYRRHGGEVVVAAIDSYVFVRAERHGAAPALLRLPEPERPALVGDVHHPLARECLRLTSTPLGGLDLSSWADVPPGTGLGSSGSFTAALLLALHRLAGRDADAATLAEQACRVEIDLLGRTVGKQDQYASAFGGLRHFRFLPDDSVRSRVLDVSPDVRRRMESSLLLFSTGVTRSAAGVLSDQVRRTEDGDDVMVANLDRTREIGRESLAALESGDLAAFGALLDEHWCNKRSRSPGMTSPAIDELYRRAREHGASGGKLVGAGGGGFLLLHAEDPERLRAEMSAAGSPELVWTFDTAGTVEVDAP